MKDLHFVIAHAVNCILHFNGLFINSSMYFGRLLIKTVALSQHRQDQHPPSPGYAYGDGGRRALSYSHTVRYIMIRGTTTPEKRARQGPPCSAISLRLAPTMIIICLVYKLTCTRILSSITTYYVVVAHNLCRTCSRQTGG